MNRELEQIKSCLRYGGARVLYALNANAVLLNISLYAFLARMPVGLKTVTNTQTNIYEHGGKVSVNLEL